MRASRMTLTTMLLTAASTLLLTLLVLQPTCAQTSYGQGLTSVAGQTTVFTPTVAQCTDAVFQEAAAQSNLPGSTAVNITSGAQLMYTLRGELCEAGMECGTRNLQTVFSVALSTSGSGTAQGVCSKITVTEVPPPVQPACKQEYNGPPNQITNGLESEIHIGVTTTRSFIYYNLIPADKVNSVAFCYAQFNTSNPAVGACQFGPPCAQASLASETPEQQCTARKIEDTWGDSAFDAEVLDRCGSETDLPQEIIGQRPGFCKEACCSSCNTATQPYSFRRWPIGPQCQVFRVGPPQLRIFGGLVVSLDPTFADASVTDEVRFQTASTNDAGQVIYQGGLPQQQTFFSPSKRVMVHANQMARSSTSLLKVNGYVIVCSSTVQSTKYPTCDMGTANPYIQTPEPSQCLANYPPFVANSIPLVAPPDATPDQLSTGTVPTFNSLGAIGKCSWYYVPQELVSETADVVNDGQLATTILSQQSQALWPHLQTQSALDTKCPGGVDDGEYFTKFIGVPGWELDPDTNKPRVTTVCQMSHALNNYSKVYKQQYLLTGDAELAKEQAAPAPPWLLPNYNIIRPNWWLHSHSLVFDLGLTYPHRTALELLVQVSDETYIASELTSDQFAVAVPQSQCESVVGNGTGKVQLVVRGLYSTSSTSTVSQYVQINCTTAINGTTKLYKPDGTQVNNQTQRLPFTALTGLVTPIHTLNMTFAPQALLSPNAAPFVTCEVQLLNDKYEPYGDLVLLGCRTTLGNASLGVEYAEDPKFGGSSTALYIGLGVLGALVIFVSIVVLIWYLTKSDNAIPE